MLNGSSAFNDTEYIREYSDTEQAAIVFSMGLFTVLAIIGNSVVIVVILRVQSMKTTTNLLLLNLCIADLIIALLCLPFITVDLYITYNWIFGDFMCRFVSFAQSVGTKASVLILTALSFERYLNICRPNLALITKTRVRMLCACLWFIAMCAALPLFIVKTSIYEGFCFEKWSPEEAAAYTFVLFAIFYAFPLLVMIALYVKIGQKLCQSTQRTNHMRQSANTGKSCLSAKSRLTKICVVIVLSFALSWAPTHILTLRYYFGDDSETESLTIDVIIFPIVYGIAFSNCAFNPLLYCFMSQNFRNAIVAEWNRLTRKPKTRLYDGLPGLSFRTRDSFLRTISMRLYGSLPSKQCEILDKEDKKQEVHNNTSTTQFESAL